MKIHTKEPLDWEKKYDEWLLVSKRSDENKKVYARVSKQKLLAYDGDELVREIDPTDVSFDTVNVHISVVKIVLQNIDTEVDILMLINLGSTCKAMMNLINNRALWNVCFGFDSALDGIARLYSIPSFLPNIRNIMPFKIVAELLAYRPYEGNLRCELDLLNLGSDYNEYLLASIQILFCTLFVHGFNLVKPLPPDRIRIDFDGHGRTAKHLNSIFLPLKEAKMESSFWFRVTVNGVTISRRKDGLATLNGPYKTVMINPGQISSLMNHVSRSLFKNNMVRMCELFATYTESKFDKPVSLMTLLRNNKNEK